MTGFGEARSDNVALSLAVEVRTLNNRHLKITVRGSEPYPMLEPELEKVIRRYVRRGTVSVRINRQRRADTLECRLDKDALRSYLEQIAAVCQEMGRPELTPHLAPHTLTLPGVVPEGMSASALSDEEWGLAEQTLEEALRRVEQMRRDEGQAMAEELLGYQRHISDELESIRTQLPNVTEAYRVRLCERINQAMKETNVTIEPEALIREVAVFADRSDVAEEVVRLASHLEQFEQIIRSPDESVGKKLEFVAQEMLRETNTIGSKAADMTISRHVVEIKATLEKTRELLQNVE